MTINDAISIVDEMKPNMMSRTLKLKYLTECEQLIHSEILLKHEHPAAQDAKPVYTQETNPETELLAPDPYSEIYTFYLMSQIDRQNQEDGRYYNDRQDFERAWDTLGDWWTREHMPIQAVREFSI